MLECYNVIILCEDAGVTEGNGVRDALTVRSSFLENGWSTFGPLWLSHPGIKQAASAAAF